MALFLEGECSGFVRLLSKQPKLLRFVALRWRADIAQPNPALHRQSSARWGCLRAVYPVDHGLLAGPVEAVPAATPVAWGQRATRFCRVPRILAVRPYC